MKARKSVLFLGKSGDDFCAAALSFCRDNFETVLDFRGEWGDPFPTAPRNWRGDYIISYLSRWIVPEFLLSRARIASINFHPAPPEFPGIGCCNFALYNRAIQYGATCHHMWRVADTGPIIAVRRFPMSEADDVASLLKRTYAAQFELFLEIGWMMRCGKSLPVSAERWTRQPYTRQEFNKLNRIPANASPAEEALRIRSCAFGPYRPKHDEIAPVHFERTGNSFLRPQIVLSRAENQLGVSHCHLETPPPHSEAAPA